MRTIKELYNAVESAVTELVLRGMKGIAGNRYSLSRPTYIESLVKNPTLPGNFGESFDNIMSEKYGLEEATTKARFTELGKLRPEMAVAMERASLQHHDLFTLLEDSKEWIENHYTSFKHQGNLEAFERNFREFFEKGERGKPHWHRIVTALKTFFAEELLPAYPKSPQLTERCSAISSKLDADKPPSAGTDREKLLKQMDDLQWYFDNFCYGSESIAEAKGIPTDGSSEPSVEQSKKPENRTVDGALYAFDRKLMVLPDGSVYKNTRILEDVEPCIGQTLYALLGKQYGYVTYLDFARAIYGEKTTNPATGRQAAIRKYLSILQKLLKRYFPSCRIMSERGKGWTFQEQVKQKAAVG